MKTLLTILIFLPSLALADIRPCPRADLLSGTLTSNLEDTSTATLIAAPGSGKRLYVSSVCVTNNDATVGTVVVVSCSATAAKRLRLNAAAVGGGFCLPLGQEIACDKNTALTVTPETTSAQIQAAATACRSQD
jgi:hypothetical protein